MPNQQGKIPLNIQLEAICFPHLRQTWEFLTPYLPELREWRPYKNSSEIIMQIVRDHVEFDGNDLIGYLQNHPEKCKLLLEDSYNKHYSPATFIEETAGHKYRVGRVVADREQTRVFSALAEATADYILFSWGLSRLTSEQATWEEAG